MGQKFSVFFPDDLAKKVREEAAFRNTSLSSLLQVYAEAGSATSLAKLPLSDGQLKQLKQTIVRGKKAKKVTAERIEVAIAERGFSTEMKLAIRLVLVDGMGQAEAAMECGISHRQAVNRAVKSMQL